MPVDFSLDGKVAIVTGGAGGIGLAYCRTLGEAGAAVVVVDLDEEGARSAAASLEANGIRAIAVATDVGDEAAAQAMAERAREAFGGIDILVNNAAIMKEMPRRTSLIEYPLDWWERIIRVNLTGALLCARSCVPSMIERGRGKIINQSSAGAYTLNGGPYSISKLGLVGLTINLARDLAQYKINVNAIAPGMIQDEATRSMGFAFDPAHEEQRLREEVVLEAFGPPENLCGALLYLASPASDFMTGQCLRVDGGWVLNP
jgi:NAD(P)-dependent dehydrogenase (short-subunit alcohol dehydrogenase family)